FVPPPSSDALINFINKLGYPKLVRNLSNIVTNDIFQPWRALTTTINLCLTGKTYGFKRPRVPVLQILWGVVTRAHIDFAERIWEEFTQSIHIFIEDKRNLTRYTSGKKKATLIVIPSIQFTKLIIHHLQRRHSFHPRPNSLLDLPNKESVLGYLKFSAKGTKREVFRMHIPGSLITTYIQEASYYQEYLAKAPLRPSVSIPVTSAQPVPISAPAKPQEKKRKQSTETSDKPSKAKKSKYGFTRKKRTLKSVAASVAEDAPAKEPQVAVEDADLQKALEESMKSIYDVPQGPLPPVVIREPELGKHQPLPEVPGKGKEKVTEGQVAHDLLSLYKPKKKSPMDQYIFQRRTSTPTQSFERDEPSYAELGQSESEESEKVMPGADERGQGEGQAGPDLDPSNVEADVQSIPSHVVYARSDHEHMDLDVTDVSPQPSTKQLDEGPSDTCLSSKEGFVWVKAGSSGMDHPELQELLELLDPSQVPPPPPLPLFTNQESQSKGSAAPSSSKIAASAEYQAWTTTDIRLRLSISVTSADLEMDEDMGLDEQAQSLDDEDIGSTHIPKVNLRQDWWKPFEEERPVTPDAAWSIPSSDVPVPTNNWASALASNYSPPPKDSLLAQTDDIATFMDWYYKRRGITELKPQDLKGSAFEIVKVFHPDVIHLQHQMEECHKLLTDSMDDPILRHNVSKTLPLGGPPGQVTIQSDLFFNKDLEYLRYSSKGSRPTLSISKMKAAYYLDAGLEQLVPDQFWIEKECKYDIAVMYGISHWWFQRQRFYIDRHTSEGDRSTVRAHMWILSVVRIEVFSMYGKDVERSKAFMFSIHKRLKTRRIFRNLESFVGGRVREGDYRLLKLDIEKVAVCSSLRSPKPKCTIESRAKRSSKIISLGHYSIMLASSHTVKSKTDIKSPTHYPDITRTSEGYVSIHSEDGNPARANIKQALGSTAAKPCQGDSSKFYLITGSIYTDQRGTVILATLFNESEQIRFRSFITNVNLQESQRLQLMAKEMSIHNSMLTLQTHYR
nr:hypothetical protein [Tanacetum cinerariifolium]